MTILARLVAVQEDSLGYITYVFESLDKVLIDDSKYVMCTRYPNWDHRHIDLYEVGYLNFVEIRAGIDTWYDGDKMVPYRYNGIQFMKFIAKPQESNQAYTM